MAEDNFNLIAAGPIHHFRTSSRKLKRAVLDGSYRLLEVYRVDDTYTIYEPTTFCPSPTRWERLFFYRGRIGYAVGAVFGFVIGMVV